MGAGPGRGGSDKASSVNFDPTNVGYRLQLAEITECPLAWTIGGADRFDQRPIRVPLAIFVPMMRTQEHAR